MKTTYISVFVSCLLFLSACKGRENKPLSLGTVEYYPSFLWVDAQTTPVQKTLDLDFSEDAQSDPSCYAEFRFVDNEGNPMGTDILQVMVGEETLPDNILRVTPANKEVNLTLAFTPKAEAGKHQGNLRLIKHNLNRLDNQPLKPGQQVDAFQWTLHFDKQMNPLAKLLMRIGLALAAALFLWFTCIRRCFFPHFGKLRKTMIIKKDGCTIGQQNVIFTGAKQVVFSNQKIKQGFLNRLFSGEVRTIQSALFTCPLIFKPCGRHNTDALALGNGYSVQSVPSPRTGNIPQSGQTTINIPQGRIVIELQ